MNKLNINQKLFEKELLKKKNVVSVGVGFKVVKGLKTKEKCVVVGVSKKDDISFLNKSDVVPKKLNDVKTDVIELGHIKAQNIDPTTRVRPIRPGVSIGHHKISAGTFGCVVYKNGKKYILSNNHVIANSNDAIRGQSILQPGAYDGGHMGDVVAHLDNFIPINFDSDEETSPPEEDDKSSCFIANTITSVLNKISNVFNRKTKVVSVKVENADNEVDCAIAEFGNVAHEKEIVEIGLPKGTKDAELGMLVKKYGRTTRYTEGEVIQLNATVSVDYGGKTATFTNQIITTAMSQGGDSGSLVLDKENKAVGLLYAGSNTVTILNPIKTVLSELGVTLE